MVKQGAKKRLSKNTVAIRLTGIPVKLNAKLDIIAAQEMRSKTSLIQMLLIEALEHRSKSTLDMKMRGLG